jgi:hypothetical protein
MKRYVIAAAAFAGILMGSSGAFAYHPAYPNRGVLDQDQLEQIEFQHVQSEWFPGRQSANSTRRPAWSAQARSQRRSTMTPPLTSHFTGN